MTAKNRDNEARCVNERNCAQYNTQRDYTLIQSPVPTNNYCYILLSLPQWRWGRTPATASSFLRFLDHNQWRTTVGKAPLEKRSARRRDLYLTTHNTHNRQTSKTPAGFESEISARERPQTHALDHATTGIGLSQGMKWMDCWWWPVGLRPERCAVKVQ